MTRITHSQKKVLQKIGEGHTTIKEIQNELTISQPAISKTVKKLLKHGYIEKIPKEKLKGHYFKTTNKGNATLKGITPQDIFLVIEREVMKVINPCKRVIKPLLLLEKFNPDLIGIQQQDYDICVDKLTQNLLTIENEDSIEITEFGRLIFSQDQELRAIMKSQYLEGSNELYQKMKPSFPYMSKYKNNIDSIMLEWMDKAYEEYLDNAINILFSIIGDTSFEELKTNPEKFKKLDGSLVLESCRFIATAMVKYQSSDLGVKGKQFLRD
ncbi:MarR family transcriptional regulator [Candidatus Pacearchaeota archaeon]|nr:MarR family transcriptional regulator [Candidatus Pacearchaeota archaeon]